MRIQPIAAATVVALALTAWSGAAAAQRLRIHASAAAGTGLSLGTGPATTVALRSPTYVSLDVMGSNSEQAWIRYGVALRSELEGKVTIGIVPRIAILAEWNRLEYGICGGIPIIIAPMSLYGLEAGGTVAYRVLDWLAPYISLLVAVYPLGSDLPKDSVVVMLQAHVGAQLQF